MNNYISITNYTCNGKCSCCGQCCGDMLHLSQKEIKIIDRYLMNHNIPPTPKNLLVTFDNTCPFRDETNKICKIYEVRPYICQSYICSKTPLDAIKDRELINGTKKLRSMRNLFFNDSSNALKMGEYLKTPVYDKKGNIINGI